MGTNILNIFHRNNKIRLAEFLYKHCNEVRRTPTYIRFYRRLARLIEAFEKHIQKDIYTDSFDERVTEEYIHFIRETKPMKKGHAAYRQSTVSYFKSKTIAALHKAERQGYGVLTDSLQHYTIPAEDTSSVYLSEKEIQRLNSLELSKEQSRVRDLFVLGCCTALRYSDYTRLTEANFKDNSISILTQKTDTRVVIPVHRIVKEIIQRNGGYSFLTYKDSQQNFNKMIKRICKKANIMEEVLVERTEGFKKIRKKYKKYELISSHTARRSGATNMYLAGIAPFRIMLITGHKTETAFYRYIRIQKEENAKNLSNHPYFNGKP